MTFDDDIVQATDETNLSEDLVLMLDIIDKIKLHPNGSSEFLKALSKRLKHKVPFVVMQCLSLLDIAVKNCGRDFKIEVSSRDFITELQNLVKRAPVKVVQRLAYLLKSWIDGKEFEGPEYDLLPSLYSELKAQGFAPDDSFACASTSNDTEKTAALSKQEEDDIAKAIAISLQEMKMKSAAADTADEASLYASVNKRLNELPKVEFNVKAMFDFEAVEDDELTFKTGDIIVVSDDSDSNWWKGTLNGKTGLFPVSFVTKDLNYEPEKLKENSNKEMQNDISKENERTVIIDERKMDECIELLKLADPNAPLGSDSPELQQLEENCYAMGPLIDKEIGCLDRLIHKCNIAKAQMIDALQNYHVLMQENRFFNENPTFPLQQSDPNNASQYMTLDSFSGPNVSFFPTATVAPTISALPAASQFPVAQPIATVPSYPTNFPMAPSAPIASSAPNANAQATTFQGNTPNVMQPSLPVSHVNPAAPSIVQASFGQSRNDF